MLVIPPWLQDERPSQNNAALTISIYPAPVKPALICLKINDNSLLSLYGYIILFCNCFPDSFKPDQKVSYRQNN